MPPLRNCEWTLSLYREQNFAVKGESVSSQLKVIPFPILEDNYAYFIQCEETGTWGMIDPGLAAPCLKWIESKGIKLSAILNTHHHWDHTDGNVEVKETTGCEIWGNKNDASRIPGITKELDPNLEHSFGNQKFRMISVTGHTTGHILFYFIESGILFSGDTIFNMGCGRLFEGTSEDMRNGFLEVAKLPLDTVIYCGHEYTLKNANFALSLNADNEKVKDRKEKEAAKLNSGKYTVPSTLQLEMETNPFFRTEDPAFVQSIGASDPLDCFTRVRGLRNNF